MRLEFDLSDLKFIIILFLISIEQSNIDIWCAYSQYVVFVTNNNDEYLWIRTVKKTCIISFGKCIYKVLLIIYQ